MECTRKDGTKLDISGAQSTPAARGGSEPRPRAGADEYREFGKGTAEATDQPGSTPQVSASNYGRRANHRKLRCIAYNLSCSRTRKKARCAAKADRGNAE